MGDCSVSCAFSGIRMIGEPIVFIPLIKSRYAAPIHGAELFSGEGSAACALMSPLTFPIRGEVDDCRQIGKVVESDNTKAIEDVFGPIDKFLEACVMGDKIEATGEYGAGCFIHPTIYDRMIKPLFGGESGGSEWDATFAGTSALKMVGCVFQEELSGRYKYKWVLPGVDRVHFKSDGESTQLYVDGKNVGGFGLDDFHKKMLDRGLSGFDRESIRKAKAVSTVQRKVLAEIEDSNRQANLFIDSMKVLGEEILPDEKANPLYRRQGEYIRSFFREFDPIFNRYWQEWEQGNLIAEVDQLFNLLWNFSRANRLLMPAIVGGQYPEHSETLAIADFVRRVAHDRAVEGCKGRVPMQPNSSSYGRSTPEV